jgi:hypothetical protein
MVVNFPPTMTEKFKLVLKIHIFVEKPKKERTEIRVISYLVRFQVFTAAGMKMTAF